MVEPIKKPSAQKGPLFVVATAALLFLVTGGTLVIALNRNGKLEGDLKRSQADEKTLQQTLERLKTHDIGELSAQASDYKARYQRTVLENNRLTAEWIVLKSQLEESQKSKAEHEEQSREKDKAIALMRKKEQQTSGIEEQLRGQQAENARQKEALEKMGALAETLKVENQALKKKAKESNPERLAKEINRLSSDNETMKKKLSEAQKEYADFRKQAREGLKQGQMGSKSVTDADSVIKGISAEAARAHYNLGVIHMRDSDHERAEKEFSHSLKLNPNDALAHYNLAVLYNFHLGRPKDSIPHYQAYVRLQPRAADVKDVQYQLFQLRLVEDAGSGEDLFAKNAEIKGKG